MKIARAYTKRQAVVVFDHGYHGRTNLTMALTAKNMPYKQGFGPFAPEVYRVPVAYGYRWPTGAENAGAEAAAQAIDQITKQIGAENVAAIIIEPVLGEGGFIEPAKGFLPGDRAVRQGQRHRLRRGRDPVRLLPHRPVVRLRGRGHRPRPDHHRQGHRGRSAARRRDRPRRDHGRRARGRPRRHLRRQPGGLRGRARRHRDDAASWTSTRKAKRIEEVMKAPPRRDAGEVRRHHRRHPRPWRDDRDRAGEVRHQGPEPGGRPPRSPRPATRRACWS